MTWVACIDTTAGVAILADELKSVGLEARNSLSKEDRGVSHDFSLACSTGRFSRIMVSFGGPN